MFSKILGMCLCECVCVYTWKDKSQLAHVQNCQGCRVVTHGLINMDFHSWRHIWRKPLRVPHLIMAETNADPNKVLLSWKSNQAPKGRLITLTNIPSLLYILALNIDFPSYLHSSAQTTICRLTKNIFLTFTISHTGKHLTKE